jgi:hypothetical protein
LSGFFYVQKISTIKSEVLSRFEVEVEVEGSSNNVLGLLDGKGFGVWCLGGLI